MTTNSTPSYSETGSNSLPSEAEIEAIYDSIEQHAREQYHPQLLPKLSPRLVMIVLAVTGAVGVLVGSADLKVDTTVTFETKLGQRTQPHWIVPKGVKIVRTDTGQGAIKGLGWLIGGCAGAGLWGLAGKDQRWQTFVGTLQTQWVNNYFRRHQAIVELQSMAAIEMEKQALDTQVKLNLAEQTWQFHQAIGYDPALAASMQNQNALPYGTPGTYGDIYNPGDKVEGDNAQKLSASEQSQDAELEPVDRIVATTEHPPIKRIELSKQALKMPPLTDYPATLVFGAPGGGKSTFATKIAQKKLEAGHEVIVLDPHYKLGSWKGCKVYGKGYDYDEIDEQIVAFCDEVKNRYCRLATEKDPVFKPISLLCDEFTMWGKRCTKAGQLLWTIVTDIRKVNCFALIIGHTNTLAGLGGASGAAKLILEAVLEIEIDSKQDPVSGRAVPSFQAWVKLPGMKRKDAFGVRIEPDTDTIENREGDRSQSVLVLDLPAELSEDVWEPSGKNANPEPCEPSENLGCDRRFTNLNLDYEAARQHILTLTEKHNQTEIIWMLWNARPGKTQAYETALSEFKELTKPSAEVS